MQRPGACRHHGQGKRIPGYWVGKSKAAYDSREASNRQKATRSGSPFSEVWISVSVEGCLPSRVERLGIDLVGLFVAININLILPHRQPT